jgi:Fungal chitosanase of glycosyl hydrolase group 75
MNRLIATVRGIPVYQDESTNRIFWTSGAAIDADGANGQAGKVFAYRYPSNDGLDILADAGWPDEEWTDVLYDNGSVKPEPLTDHKGNAYSKTSYVWPNRSVAERSVDACSVPYAVVNPFVRRNSVGIVMGCRAVITYNGKSVEAVVADVSGGNDIGEISIAAAEALGIDSSPRTGGVPSGVSFQLFPGTAAVVNGVTYLLQRA